MAKKTGKRGGKKRGAPEFGCPDPKACIVVTGPGPGDRRVLEFGLPIKITFGDRSRSRRKKG